MLRQSIALFLISIFAGVANASDTPTLAQWLSMKSVRNPGISPDGKYVAYLVQPADWDEKIWIRTYGLR